MQAQTKKILKFLLKLCVTAGLLSVVLARIDLGNLGQIAKEAKWGLLIIVWALAGLNLWILSWRMRLILLKMDCDVRTKKILAASSVTMLYSLFLPGVLSTGVKWYILKRHTGKASNVLSSMVYNQTTHMVVKVLFGLVAIIFTNPLGGLRLPLICAILTIVITGGCVSLLNWRTSIAAAAAIRYIFRPWPKKIRAGVDTMIDQIKVFRKAGWSFHLGMMAIALLHSAVSVVIYIFAVQAARAAVPAAALIWQSSAVYVLGRIPISIANLGVREYTLVEFLKIYGVEAPTALLVSMIIFSCALFLAGMGAAVQLFWGTGAKKAVAPSRKAGVQLGDE
jgi:hypothetical protein